MTVTAINRPAAPADLAMRLCGDQDPRATHTNTIIGQSFPYESPYWADTIKTEHTFGAVRVGRRQAILEDAQPAWGNLGNLINGVLAALGMRFRIE